jgi:peptide deformylase
MNRLLETPTYPTRILKIARMGHPILYRKAEEVSDPTDPLIHQHIDDMKATLEDLGAVGTGLAAPQVHLSLRIIFFAVSQNQARDSHLLRGIPLTPLINPTYETISEEMESGWEGCLSIPGLRGLVPRFKSIRYTYRDLQGETKICVSLIKTCPSPSLRRASFSRSSESMIEQHRNRTRPNGTRRYSGSDTSKKSCATHSKFSKSLEPISIKFYLLFSKF